MKSEEGFRRRREHPFMWSASIVCILACVAMILMVVFGLY